jgi:hypothetical protein
MKKQKQRNGKPALGGAAAVNAKSSFAAFFTMLSLLLILGIVLSFSLVTLVSFHSIPSAQVENRHEVKQASGGYIITW